MIRDSVFHREVQVSHRWVPFVSDPFPSESEYEIHSELIRPWHGVHYRHVLLLRDLVSILPLWRLFFNYSTWNNDKAEQVCLECHCQSGTNFAIKCELKERPYTIIIVAITVSIFVFGFAMRSAEVPYMYVSGDDWTNLWNAMWCTIITMATVGYGDYVPQTHVGRIIAVLACIWGNFLISLMVVSLTISSEFNPN